MTFSMNWTWFQKSPELAAQTQLSTRTAKILRPSIVLAMLISLFLCATIGLGATIAIFASKEASELLAREGVNQAFMIIASGVSFLYITLHIVAASHKKPAGDIRPAQSRIYAPCFIVARSGLLLWLIALITCIIVVACSTRCSANPTMCHTQALSLVVAILSTFVMGILLIALETLAHPFEVPKAFAPRPSSSASTFRDDLINHNVSTASSFNARSARESRSERTKGSIDSIISSVEFPMPGAFSIERHPSPILPMIPISKASAWSEEINDLVSEDGWDKRAHSKADSAISVGSETCSDSCRSECSTQYDPLSKELPPCPRAVTPSSSISNESLRSPLSRVRSAEFPEIIYQPQLRFFPTNSPEQRSKAPRAIAVRRIRRVNDNASLPTDASTQMALARRLGPPSHSIPRKPITSNVARRSSVDIRIPGAYVERLGKFDEDEELEEHTRRIMTKIHTRSREGPKQRLLVDHHLVSSDLGVRDQQPLQSNPPSLTEIEQCINSLNAYDEEDDEDEVTVLKRLTLEDISAEFEDIFSSFKQQTSS